MCIGKDEASLRPWTGSREGGKETTILLLRLQYEKQKIRYEIKPVAVRSDTSVSVLSFLSLTRGQAHLSVKEEGG